MPSPFTPPQARPLAGILLCVTGLFFFSLQDLMIKYFSAHYSLMQLVWVRGVVAAAAIAAAVVARYGWRGLQTRQPGILLLRGVFGFFSYASYYMAVAALPLVDVVTIAFTAPVMVMVMSALLLREPVGLRHWWGVAAGFLAMIIVVGPRGDLRHMATLLALFAAFAYSASIVTTRFIGGGERPWTITLYSMLVFIAGSCIAALALPAFTAPADNAALQFLLRAWTPPRTAADFWLMLALGLNAALSFYCVIKAYWLSPASVIAPFEYTYIIWAVVFGWFVWGEPPRISSLTGVAILIGSSLYLLRREVRLSRGG